MQFFGSDCKLLSCAIKKQYNNERVPFKENAHAVWPTCSPDCRQR